MFFPVYLSSDLKIYHSCSKALNLKLPRLVKKASYFSMWSLTCSVGSWDMYFLQILNHSCVEYVNAFMFMRKKKCNALLGFFFFFIIVPHYVSYEIDLFVCLVFTTVIHHRRCCSSVEDCNFYYFKFGQFLWRYLW